MSSLGSASVPPPDLKRFLNEECKVMVANALMLADGIFVMEWYSWAGIVGIIVLGVGYKIYKDKTMT